MKQTMVINNLEVEMAVELTIEVEDTEIMEQILEEQVKKNLNTKLLRIAIH